MADGKTQVIIITSNEDLIREISSKKRTNTHLIDLDDNEHQFVNLTVLAQLSQSNEKNDLIYRTALHSPNNERRKSKKMPMICAVCGDRAIGYNFDVVSCGACRAFFRRNAHQHLEKFKCLNGENQCSIEFGTRRNCTRCRLDRCFNVGMRKEFFMTEEEKQLRREHLKQIQTRSSTSDSNILTQTLDQIDQLMMNINEDEHLNEKQSSESLSIEDWLTIENVRTSFVTTFEKDEKNYSHVDLSNAENGLITWSHFFSDLAMRFICFFRQIDQFENLHADDRFILIKNNLFSIYPISRCFNFKSINDYSSFNADGILRKHSQLLNLCGASNSIHQLFIDSVSSMFRLSEQDSNILILLIIVLIFTHRLSMNEDEPPLNDPLAVYRAQSSYTTLLCNYLIDKHGELQGHKHFIQIFNVILRLQSLTKTFQDFFRSRMMSTATLESIAPLMQTVLHIS